MHATIANSVALILALTGSLVHAQELQWRPSSGPPEANHSRGPQITLGLPIPLGQPMTSGLANPSQPVQQASGTEPGAAESRRLVVRGQIPDPVPPPGGGPPPPPPPPAGAGAEEAYNCGVVAGGKAPGSSGTIGGFFSRCWDKCTGFCKDGACSIGGCFQTGPGGKSPFLSDHSFDTFISPVSNPFYAEDPRALTEVRPIFIWQHTPGSNPIFSGGNNFFFGLQGRLAVTDWLSVVVNKLGWVWLDPKSPPPGFTSGNGISELHLGPKVTFLRNSTTGTYLAGGLTFELPIGSDTVLQGTGNLTLDPYVSFAQNFGKSSYGSFNFMNTTGYAFSLDSQRTDFFHSSFHLDFDVGNFHKIYPLVELNWFHYTGNGTATSLGFEGSDLFNAGSDGVAGKDELRLAVGARYKFTENIQIGGAAEFSLLGGGSHLDQFRLTIDMIFRY